MNLQKLEIKEFLPFKQGVDGSIPSILTKNRLFERETMILKPRQNAGFSWLHYLFN